MSVMEYEAKFDELSRYAPQVVATDEMRAKHFGWELRPTLKRKVEAFELQTYAAVVAKAQILERGDAGTPKGKEKMRSRFEPKSKILKSGDSQAVSFSQRKTPDVHPQSRRRRICLGLYERKTTGVHEIEDREIGEE